MREIVLKAENISYSYEYSLFKNLSFELKEQEILHIDGPSGCGKSTLLNVLSTFLKPQNGKLELFGKDVATMSESEILKIRREDIGIIFQTPYLHKGLTVKENIEVSLKLSATKNYDYLTLLNRLDLIDTLNQKVGELSGGQQQRVSIVRTILKNPKIIFADEPGVGLDSVSLGLVEQELLRTKSAIIYISHI